MVSLRSESTDMEQPHSRPRLPHARPPSNPRAVATTSRRGGRTRARSPAVSVSRMEENPSSAAAAAAAAAKAYSSGRSSASVNGRDDRSTSSGYAPPPPGYEASYPPPHKWPGGDPSKRGSSRMHYPPRGYGPPPGYNGGVPPGYPPPHHEGYGDRRYHRGEHSRGPPPPGHEHCSRYPVDYRYHSRGAGLTTPPKGSRGGTSLVLGGATPIHVPKTAAPPPPPAPAGPPERPTRASTASVFRGRSDTSAPPPMAEDESSKVLLSLRTPSTSFEEKKESDGTSINLSPDDPPKIMSSTQQQRVVEMFEKSPDGTRSTTNIDMNASFTLFNQSFDSFGENYFNVDSTLHTADSFGMNRTGSILGPRPSGEEPPPGLQPNLSNAGLQANLSSTMLGPSPSEQLTIGYSPVNSFGNPAQSPKRSGSGSMMVLGGPEHRSNSPTQVLGMYRSYSGSRGPHPPRMEELPSSYRGGGYGEHSYRHPPPPGYDPYDRPPQPHMPPPPPPHEGQSDRMPPFYIFLCQHREAFKGCNFLLPGLKAALLDAPNQDHSYEQQPYEQPSPQDVEIARRRVESSVFAFGGNHGESSNPNTGIKDTKPSDTNSIFRGTTDDHASPSKESATVTPSSSVASPSRNYSRAKARYDEVLPGRYYENESRLSWEFEENPPVEVTDEESADKEHHNNSGRDSKNGEKERFDAGKSVDSDEKRSAPSPQPKMKYRCKLCGQPKQNHTCPYQQSLARSIGVMVYPAVNAFTAAEPGTISPALSEMNNFIDVKDLNTFDSVETPQPRPTPERSSRYGPSSVMASPKQVTPEQLRSSPSPIATPKMQNKDKRGTKRSYGGNSKEISPGDAVDDQGDLLFVESMELKPQQFLTVSSSMSLSPDAYTYAALPLPYAQRKRLSDNLFSLSNEIPHLTDECAVVLREAREKDMWDMAVAELITQVLVVTRCTGTDHRFEGLSQYLLTLGISC